MSNVKIALNPNGVQELLKEVGSSSCMKLASNIASRCGEGYVAEERKYPKRTAAIIKPDTYAAYRDNLENNTIVKSVWGG